MKYLIAALLLVGCAESPVSRHSTNNPDVGVSVLFEVDGCKVYRFSDAGHYRYFTTCQGSVSSSLKQGKSTRPESISTEIIP